LHYHLWIVLNVGQAAKLLDKVIGILWQGTVHDLFGHSPGKTRESGCNGILICFPET